MRIPTVARLFAPLLICAAACVGEEPTEKQAAGAAGTSGSGGGSAGKGGNAAGTGGSTTGGVGGSMAGAAGTTGGASGGVAGAGGAGAAGAGAGGSVLGGASGAGGAGAAGVGGVSGASGASGSAGESGGVAGASGAAQGGSGQAGGGGGGVTGGAGAGQGGAGQGGAGQGGAGQAGAAGAPIGCGNGVVDTITSTYQESCDGAAVAPGLTCASVLGGSATGTLACTPHCQLDLTACSTAAACGDTSGLAASAWAMDGGCPRRVSRSSFSVGAKPTEVLPPITITDGTINRYAAHTPTLGVDGSLYLPLAAGGPTLLSLSPTGTERWQKGAIDTIGVADLTGAVIGLRAGVEAVFWGGDNEMYAFSPADGTQLWKRSVTGFYEIFNQEPLVLGDRLWISGTGDPGPYGAVQSLDVADGSEKDRILLDASPATTMAAGLNGRIYLVQHAAAPNPISLVAIDTATKSIAWTHNLTLGGGPSSGPVVSPDGTIYQITDGYLYVIADGGATSSEVVPPVDLGVNSFYGTPAIGADGTVYLNTEGDLVAIHGKTGVIRWRKPGQSRHQPVIDRNGLILRVTTSGGLEAVRPDGKAHWTLPLFEATGIYEFVQPVIASDKRIYVAKGGPNGGANVAKIHVLNGP